MLHNRHDRGKHPRTYMTMYISTVAFCQAAGLELESSLLVRLEQFVWNYCDLHLLEKWQDHSHQKTAELHWGWWWFASLSDGCPRYCLWKFLPGGATHNFINTFVLEENKTNPSTGSRNEFTKERSVRAPFLLLPKVRVWTLCARY